MATIDQHTNFAYSTVATAPSPASSGTSLIVQTGDGAKFPTPPFNATIWPTGANPFTTNAEIVRVTGISTDTFTITRNTTTENNNQARSVVVGDQIAATITAATITNAEEPKLTASFTFDGQGRYSEQFYGAGTAAWNSAGVSPDTTGAAGAYRVGTTLSNGNRCITGSHGFSGIVGLDTLTVTNNACELFIGVGAPTVNQTTGHTFTDRHIGFKLLATGGAYKLYATVADGSTETASSALETSFSNDDILYVKYWKNSTTSVDFWWSKNAADWQKVNLTTNIPDSSVNQWSVSVTNHNTTDQLTCKVISVAYLR